MARLANVGRPLARSKEGFMFRNFLLAALELFPGLLRPLAGSFPESADGDNRGSIDPNG